MSGKPRRASPAVRARRARRKLADRLKRLAHYRLVIPLKRSRHPPEYTARGVGVGFAVGMTPTAGLQLILCGLIWLVAKRLFRWDFNVLMAMVWTWNSNVFTIAPIYYLCYVSGQFLLGNWGDLLGYHTFLRAFGKTIEEPAMEVDPSGLVAIAEGSGGHWDWVGHLLSYFLTDVFLVMILGSLPWFALSFWLAYRWTMRFMERHHLARSQRRATRQAARRGA